MNPIGLLLLAAISIGVLMSIVQINSKLFAGIVLGGSIIQLFYYHDLSAVSLYSICLVWLMVYNGWVAGYLLELDKLGKKVFPPYLLPPIK